MSKNSNNSAATNNINPRPVAKKFSPTAETAVKHNKYKVSYFDKNGNFRLHFANSTNDRDALVDSWLNNKHIVEPVSVEQV